MTTEEIKTAIKAKGYTQAEFAKKLGVAPSTLTNALSGITPMTKALHNHIALLLEKERDVVIVYKIELPEAKVVELCGQSACQTEEDRHAAIEAIVHHNLQELIELGKQCMWSEQEREYLGLGS